jgi:hypothetical protein
MQQQKNQLLAENQELQDKIAYLQSIKNEGVDYKKKYMEGAVWMGKKLSNEIEQACQSFEFLLMEYSQRLTKGDGEAASNWLVEAVKQAGFDLYEKSITILESAVFHMDDAEKAMNNDI